MNDDNHDNQAKAVKLSEKFVDFIDLTDKNLEEVAIIEFGIQGGAISKQNFDCAGYCGAYCEGNRCGAYCTGNCIAYCGAYCGAYCEGCCGRNCGSGCGGGYANCGGGCFCGGCGRRRRR